jgi:hypothetical protein
MCIMRKVVRWAGWGVAAAFLASMVACGQLPSPPQAPAGDGLPWREVRIPGKASTDYRWATHPSGVAGWYARADRSASAWFRQVHVAPQQLGTVAFSWWVPSLLPEADLTDPDLSDSPAAVLFAFEGDRSLLSPRNKALFELAQLLGGEPPPYATLMYVWDRKAAPEKLIVSGRTDRIRKIVVESGPGSLRQWRSYQRRLREDFIKAFGEEPGPLVGVALMTDADNTGASAEAWYGAIELR